ncbi:autotransporter-associated beta strand repeat-containing protein, partial [Rhizobiaceae sp. 2RAB30]
AGDLVKKGSGTLSLTGASAYGNTIVEAGTLVGDASSISGSIGNAGKVVFDQADNGSFSGNIAGLAGTKGTVVKDGAGRLVLKGTSTLDWAVAQGSLVTAADRFSGDVDIGRGGAFTFDQSGTASYAGTIAGRGAFGKAGDGTVILTGDSTAFAGTTTVSEGSLIVGQGGSGALGGSLFVESGGMLGGTGTLGTAGSAVTIAAGGVHAPGNSIGSQTILGDYANHGTLRIEGTPGAADKVIVNGKVDITGATLALLLSPTTADAWAPGKGPFTLIDNRGADAVKGMFGAITGRPLFLSSTLDYAGGDGNDVTLKLER